jgi:anti-sigma factor RsiW
MIDRHPSLDDLLDRRLSGEEHRAAELHLGDCDRCRTEWLHLSAMRELLRRTADAQEVPEEVRQRVEAALQRAHRPTPRLTWIAAAATLAAAAVLVVMMIVLGQRNQPEDAAGHYRSVAATPATLETRTSKPAELERWFAERLPFKPDVYDFAMMGLELRGGRIEDIDGAPASVAVYRDSSGRVVVCEMYLGSAEDLPEPVQRREHNGIEFLVYEHEGVQLVFWQEGSVICVLSAEMPREELLALAFAKAKRV